MKTGNRVLGLWLGAPQYLEVREIWRHHQRRQKERPEGKGKVRREWCSGGQKPLGAQGKTRVETWPGDSATGTLERAVWVDSEEQEPD